MFADRLKHIDVSGIRKMFELAQAPGTINLAIGEPDFPIPPQSKEAVRKALDDDFTKYTPGKGIPPLREALVKKLKKDNDINCTTEEIICTSGASEALHLAIEALVNPGDEVIIPDPGFVSYAPLTRMAGGIPVAYNVDEERGFEPTAEDIKAKITHKTKLIIINSPGNPTGAVFSKDTIKSIAELSDDMGIKVISDEVYEKIVYGKEHISLGKYTKNAITVNGFSKSFAMTGLRLGYVAAELEVIEEMFKVHQYIQASTVTFSQVASLAAIGTTDDFINNMVKTFKERRDLILEILEDIDGVTCFKPDGAFYVFPNFSEYGSAPKLVMEFLKEARVVTTPGTAFGNNAQGNVRFSYATSNDKIQEGIERIKKYLEEKK